jgi:hypothetical protein
VIALLLDLANIVGGFLLAMPVLRRVPRFGGDLARVDTAVAPYSWVVGLVALVTGGFYLIKHVTQGPHVFHFEVVALGVGVALLWDRLTGRASVRPTEATEAEGAALLLAVFGIIAIVVGLEGLLTPN